jgi:hypothetical protein
MITTSVEWTSEDIGVLRTFLETKTGEKFLPKLAESTPGLLDRGAVEQILIRSGEVRGLKLVLEAIVSLAFPPPPPVPEVSNYPDLTDDNKWPDGEKLTKTE